MYPSIESKEGNFPMKGIGWHYQEEDFIWNCLYKLSLPYSSRKFVDKMVEFLRANRPRGEDEFNIETFDYFHANVRLIGCLKSLQRFYLDFVEACKEKEHVIPTPEEEFDVPEDYSHVAETATLTDIVFMMTMPLSGEYIKHRIDYDVRQTTPLPQMIDLIIEQSRKFTEILRPAHSAISHMIEENARRERRLREQSEREARSRSNPNPNSNRNRQGQGQNICYATVAHILQAGNMDDRLYTPTTCPRASIVGGYCNCDHSRKGIKAFGARLVQITNTPASASASAQNGISSPNPNSASRKPARHPEMNCEY